MTLSTSNLRYKRQKKEMTLREFHEDKEGVSYPKLNMANIMKKVI